jgi:pimeloyl-ACP methyl ester carboxylesterase
MVKMIGMPAIFTLPMRFNPNWKAMLHNAPSLPHDAAIMQGYGFPTHAAKSIRVPTVVIGGDKSFPQLRAPLRMAAETIPGATFVMLKGQGHDVAADAVAPVLVDFFLKGAAKAAA